MSDVGFIEMYLQKIRGIATNAQIGREATDEEIEAVVTAFDKHAAILKDGSNREENLRRSIGQLKLEIACLAPDPKLGGSLEQQAALNAPRIAVLEKAIATIEARLAKTSY